MKTLTLWANERTGWMELSLGDDLLWAGSEPWAESIVEIIRALGHEVTVEMDAK